MDITKHWVKRTPVLLQTILMAFSFLSALTVRAIVSADTISDQFELALNTTTIVVLLIAVAMSWMTIRAAHAPAPRASMILMSFLMICLTVAFIRLTYADVSIEIADLIQPAEAAEGASQIEAGPTGQDARLSGDIKEGAADLLEKLLKANPSIRRIHLTSDGGFAEEGQALADVIAAHHLTTYVSDYCMSACTLAFVAGEQRILMDGARLGFHAPYQQGLLGQTFVGDAKEQRDAYRKAGLSADFVDEALKVAPDDIWIPERDRLLKAHVVTGYVDRYRLPDSILDGEADSQGARETVLRNFPILNTIDAGSPQVIDQIATWYLDAYKRGMSEGDATDGLEKIVSATIVLVLARADDKTLLDLARFVQTAIHAEESTEECETIGGNINLTRAVAALEESDKTAEALAESLVRRALAAGRRPKIASRVAPIAFLSNDVTCESIRKDYANVLAQSDLTPLRHRLEEAAPRAARLLAPLAETKP